MWVFRSSSVSQSSMCFLAESDKDFGGVKAATRNHFEQRLAYYSSKFQFDTDHVLFSNSK